MLAPRLALLCATTALAGVALSSPAQAQFACIGVAAVLCTNTGADTNAPFQFNQTGTGTLSTTNSGSSDGIDTRAENGSNTTTNTATGIVNGDMVTGIDPVTGIGPATGINAGTVTGNIETFTRFGGLATTTNSGIVGGDASAAAQDGGNSVATNTVTGTVFGTLRAEATSTANPPGNATVNNSGTVTDTRAFADGGGNATANNFSTGIVLGNLNAATSATGAGMGAGTATVNNFGSAFMVQAQTFDFGRAVANNYGTTLFLLSQSITDGDAAATNTGSVAGPMVVSTGASGNALATNSGYVGGGILTSSATCGCGDGDATTLNSGVVDGGIVTLAAPNSMGNARTENSGTVNGDIQTISEVGDSTFINRGTVNGDVGVIAGASGFGTGNVNFFNTGTITTAFGGVIFGSTDGNSVGFNSGRIFGGVTGANFFGGSVTFTNAGTIVDNIGLGYAIDLSQFSFGTPITSTLNIMPSSRITGLIFLAGDPLAGDPGTNVNIFTGRNISQVLTFGDPNLCGCGGGLIDTGSIVNVTGGAPYVISGNSVAWLDPTSFVNSDRNLVDMTRSITLLIAGRLSSPAPFVSNTPLGFAPSRSVVADMTRDAFASVQPLSYAPVSSVARDGTSVWAQGFGAARTQRAEGITLRSVNNFYGGMLGVDRMVASDLRLGGFIGAGEIKSRIDLLSGDTSSRLVFGAVYGRKWFGETFVDFSLLGGQTRDDSRRLVANNLAPGGFDIAAANFDSWFVSPELALGKHFRMTPDLTVVPVLRGRYLGIGHGAYAELGSLANLTVAARSTGFFEERAEVSLIRTQTPPGGHFMQVSGTIGVLGLHRTGDASVNSTLLGQTLAFAVPGKKDAFGGFVGTAFEWRGPSGWGLFSSAEFTWCTDASHTLSGKAGARYAF